jgi:cytochrome c oxidase cbb3-type subunit III
VHKLTAAITTVVATLAAVGLLPSNIPAQSRKGAAQQKEATRSEATADGRQVFEGRCAGCHGLDGRGGERAPDIATAQKTQGRPDSELSQIITNGIPGTGMPAAVMLDPSRISAVVVYLRFLQGRSAGAKFPGNPATGKSLFAGKAGCAQCHLMRGEGGFIASDLTSYARTHSVAEIRESIIANDSAPSRQAYVQLTARNGEKYRGLVRNQDNFSLQLQALDGTFHLFMRSEIADIKVETHPLMPSDYGTRLNATELNDLISYLISVADGESARTGSSAPSKENEDD